MKFSLNKTSGRARRGILQLGGQTIETPIFMPVATFGTIRALETEAVWDMGYRLILGNTYHLSMRPGMGVINKFAGVKPFMNWDGALLTDSGGFQIFSLAKIRKLDDDGVTFSGQEDGGAIHRLTPETALEIQRDLGSDIAMLLDVCPPYPCSDKELKDAVSRTIDWARRAAEWIKNNEFAGSAFCITQGGVDADIRNQCLEELIPLDFPGMAVGGLSVGEPNELMYETLERTLEAYPKEKPRYLMGVGTPEDLLECAKLGIDMFDCVMPTRNARRAQMFTTLGVVNIKNNEHESAMEPVDPNCACKVCKTYSRAYLRHLFMNKELLGYTLATYHNLYFYYWWLQEIRNAIDEDRLDKLEAP